VIVTVRRPGLAAAVEADLATLGPVLLLADFCAVAGRVRLSSHFAQIRPAVLDGLSFLTVARRTDRLASQAADNPREYIPHVYWEHTTANVITLEAVSGASLDDVAEAARQNSAAVTAPSEDPPAGCVDARKVARNLLYNHLRQVLNGRYLNCHPAAKTLVVLDDHSIAYLDCRAVYRLDSRFADRQMEVISAARAGDVNALFQSLWECLEAPADAPAAEFESSFHARVSEWLDLAEDPRAAPDARSVLALLDGILDDCRRCQIPAPHSLVACHHAFGETVACVREVAPEIDMEAELAATLQEMLTERIEKSIDTRTLSQTVLEYEQFLVTLPHQLRQVMRSIRQERAPLERSVNVWELRSWGLAQLLATLAIPATAAVWAWRQWNPAPAIAVVITLLLLRRASRLGYERSAVGHRRVRVN
jgi:ubiquinone biosynthesis protein